MARLPGTFLIWRGLVAQECKEVEDAVVAHLDIVDEEAVEVPVV